jgi:protein-S-isoprenylcysteine O-methyltransferase Ste14
MSKLIYRLAANIALVGGYARGAGVTAFALRTYARRQRFRTLRFGVVEVVATAEPIALLSATFVASRRARWHDPSAADVAFAAAGAAASAAGCALLAWSLASWPSTFFGHGVMPEQKLVRDGAYGFVRHPLYVAAFLIWLGLGAALRSRATLAVLALYVAPAYVAYARSEERMMREEFGAEYEAYEREVGGFLPKYA